MSQDNSTEPLPTSAEAIAAMPDIGKLVTPLSLTDRLRLFGAAHALCGDDPEFTAIGQLERFLASADHDARVRVLRWAHSYAEVPPPQPVERWSIDGMRHLTRRSPKHCSICKRTGHDKRSCPRKPKKKYGADAVELPEAAP